MKPIAACLLAAAVALAQPVVAREMPASGYVMPDTRVMTFTSKDGQRTLRLLVGLPRDYAIRSERFPVIYLLDADFAFPLAQEIQRHTTDRGFERESIVIGLAYPGAEADLKVYQRTRTRDYTPSHTPDGGYGPEVQKLSGEGPAFLALLRDELIPFVDAQFRTRPQTRTIVGHSFGGLFAAYAMIAAPGLFSDYLMVSPSLWYDRGAMFGVAQHYLAEHRALQAHVFYAVGAREAYGDHDMVGDLRRWDAMLGSAHVDGYRSTLEVYAGETHESVFPGALTRGLRVLADFAGEAAGNKLERPAAQPR